MIVESIATLGDAATGARAARHFDLAFGRILAGPRAVQGASWLRFVSGTAHPMGNVAILRRPDDLDATLEAVLPLLDCGEAAAVIFVDGVDEAVAATVKARGFAVEAKMPAMAVDIDRLAATTLPTGYRFVRVGAGDESRAWTDALALGYEIPQELAEYFSPDALGADPAPDASMQWFAVLRDGRPVATSMLYLADGLAGIYCVSTLPGERRRGLGAHATAEALRAARRLGHRVGVLQSSTAGYPVYVELGFAEYAALPMLIHLPG